MLLHQFVSGKVNLNLYLSSRLRASTTKLSEFATSNTKHNDNIFLSMQKSRRRFSASCCYNDNNVKNNYSNNITNNNNIHLNLQCRTQFNRVTRVHLKHHENQASSFRGNIYNLIQQRRKYSNKFNNDKGEFDVDKALDIYAGYHLRSVTLQQLTDFGKHMNFDIACKSTNFVQQELCVRLAHIVKELDSLPGLLLNMKPVQQVKEWYIISFKELLQFPPLDSLKGGENERIEHMNKFNNLLDRILARHAPVVMTIAQGILEVKKKHGRKYMDLPIRYFLDRIYMSRIGIRLLIGQHTEVYKEFQQKGDNANTSKERDNSLIGLVDENCQVKEILEDAYHNAAFLCRQYYNVAPEMKVYYPTEIQGFTYIPSHLYHILFELLKNSMRAIVEFHEDSDELPVIKAVIVKGTEDITIKISDEGGGIPRSDLVNANSYLYSSAVAPELDDDMRSDINHAPLAGFGYGLPLSRLYARYLGGDLQIISLEGYGTDAYVHVKATATESSEILPTFSSSAIRHYNANSTPMDWINPNHAKVD